MIVEQWRKQQEANQKTIDRLRKEIASDEKNFKRILNEGGNADESVGNGETKSNKGLVFGELISRKKREKLLDPMPFSPPVGHYSPDFARYESMAHTKINLKF